MVNPDRLTALDATFLHLERANGVNMHVASCMIFEGEIPPYTEFLEGIGQAYEDELEALKESVIE